MKVRNDEILLKFGIHLKNLRVSKGFTQESFSYEADITLSQIARIETGKTNPTLCTLILIAKTLGLKNSDLFDFE